MSGGGNLRLVQHAATGDDQGRQADAADDGCGHALGAGDEQRAADDAQAAEDHEVEPAEPCHGLEAVFDGHIGGWDGEGDVDDYHGGRVGFG